MGPPMRQEMLLGVGTLLLLLLPTTANQQRSCPSNEFYNEDVDKCMSCKLCLKESNFREDGSTPQEICQRNNPHPFAKLESRNIYLWCSSQSYWVTKAYKRMETVGTKSTTVAVPKNTPTVAPAYSQTTEVQHSVTPEVQRSKPRDNTLGNITSPILAVASVSVFIILIVGLIYWVISRRRWRSSSSLSTESDRLSEEGQELNPDMPKVIIDSRPTEEDLQTSPPPDPILKYVNIFATENQEVRVSKGADVILDASKRWGDDTVAWLHTVTKTKLFGSRITISSIGTLQGGEYIASNGSENASVTLNVTRPGEQHEEPLQIVSFREAVEYGPEPVESSTETEAIESSTEAGALESSTETGSPEENEQSMVLWQPSTPSQPSQPEKEDIHGTIVPSGQCHAVLGTIVEQVNTLMNFVGRQRQVVPHCNLNLRELLQDQVAIQQLAILLDPTSMLRLFAAIKGEMSVDDINYVWYSTKGTGNTIRGLFEHLVDKGCGDCTAAGFSRFMIENRWKGCDKVIHLLYRVHLKREEHCKECEDLHKRYGPTEIVGDVRYQNSIPAYQYHLNNAVCHCDQTIKELSRGPRYGEPFRQASAIPFCDDNELWWFVGSDLIGMSTEHLEHIRNDNVGPARYLKMLDFMVELHPELLVATLLEWLMDHSHLSAAILVLEHHEEQMKKLRRKECAYCRTIRNKRFRLS